MEHMQPNLLTTENAINIQKSLCLCVLILAALSSCSDNKRLKMKEEFDQKNTPEHCRNNYEANVQQCDKMADSLKERPIDKGVSEILENASKVEKKRSACKKEARQTFDECKKLERDNWQKVQPTIEDSMDWIERHKENKHD